MQEETAEIDSHKKVGSNFDVVFRKQLKVYANKLKLFWLFSVLIFMEYKRRCYISKSVLFRRSKLKKRNRSDFGKHSHYTELLSYVFRTKN